MYVFIVPHTRACGIALLLHTYGGLHPLLTANM